MLVLACSRACALSCCATPGSSCASCWRHSAAAVPAASLAPAPMIRWQTLAASAAPCALAASASATCASAACSVRPDSDATDARELRPEGCDGGALNSSVAKDVPEAAASLLGYARICMQNT